MSEAQTKHTSCWVNPYHCKICKFETSFKAHFEEHKLDHLWADLLERKQRSG